MSVGLYLRSFCGFALQTFPCAILLLLPFREEAFAKGKRNAYAAYVFSQLSGRDGVSPDRTKGS